ncbi:MSMEG_0565 family glycosyltransferase [uncultured Jatrophihabitans sp.]|uniref:MSMEG_0565 family glycosyltransferase n=1 Tax=uncultured Jatrophihabitans sp. TaxID=1610747 RepID=UPI0035CB525D
MRVALLTYSTRPRGGVVHTLALAEALADLGAQVDVWSLARGGDAGFFRPVAAQVGVRLVPFAERADEPVGERIVRSIDVLGAAFAAYEVHYDVVHAQDCISANAVARCIRTVHHLDAFTTPQLAACHERAIVEPVAHVCVSAAVAAQLHDGWGIAADVIPNGIDADRFAAAATDHAGRERWAHRLGRYVLAVGGIEPRKGTADLVEAMAAVQRDDPALRLVVAGGETLFDYRAYRETVLARAAQLGVGLEVLGPVPHDDLPTLVAQAEVFAFPSVNEGFGMAAMEAMAAGAPVVTRDLPVLREVFRGAAAFADDPAGLAEAIAAASRRPDAARIAAGRVLAYEHTWPSAAQAHLAVYERVTNATVPPVTGSPLLRAGRSL